MYLFAFLLLGLLGHSFFAQALPRCCQDSDCPYCHRCVNDPDGCPTQDGNCQEFSVGYEPRCAEVDCSGLLAGFDGVHIAFSITHYSQSQYFTVFGH